jgi:phosphatidylinositol alpha-1,6-mannosyltransferase
MISRNISGDVEGFGIVYLEANLFGKAVVGGNSGGVGEAVVDGKSGLLVDPSDETAIMKSLEELMTSEEKRNALGLFGKDRAEREFSWERQTKRFFEIIKE